MPRGRRATGMAWWGADAKDPKDMKVWYRKDPVDATKFIKDHGRFVNEAGESGIVIAHTRMPTHGDPNITDNNHPIIAGDIAGVHNGVVDNDDLLYTTLLAGVERKGLVDSRAIFDLLNLARADTEPGSKERLAAMGTALEAIEGSVAVAYFCTDEPHTLYLARGQWSPLIIAHHAEYGIAFASETRILTDALDEIGHPAARLFEVETLMTGELLRIDADYNLTTHAFDPPWQSRRVYSAHTPTSAHKPAGPHGPYWAKEYTWYDVDDEFVTDHPALDDPEVWNALVSGGAETTLGFFDAADQALALVGLVPNLFIQPADRDDDIDLVLSQHHLRLALDYVVKYLMDKKDRRHWNVILDIVYNNLGVHLVGEDVRFQKAHAIFAPARIVAFPQITNGDIQSAKALLYTYEDTVPTLRFAGSFESKPYDVREPKHLDRLEWLSDLALAICCARETGSPEPDLSWLDPSQEIASMFPDRQVPALPPATPVVERTIEEIAAEWDQAAAEHYRRQDAAVAALMAPPSEPINTQMQSRIDDAQAQAQALSAWPWC